MIDVERSDFIFDLKCDSKYYKDAFDKFDDFIKNELGITANVSDDYRFIIGESQYPTASNIVSTLGVAKYSNSVYSKENIPEIAFLSQQYTCDFFLILGILFNSMDKGAIFFEWLHTLGLANNDIFIDFALYLFYRHKILLFNRYTKNGKSYHYRSALVTKLLTSGKYQPLKILVVGKRTTSNFNNLVKSNGLSVVHPGAYNGIYCAKNWCETYFCRHISTQNSINLLDFRL